MSPENKKKFSSVIHHYKGLNDTMKLEATYYIIKNIRGLGSYNGRQLDDFNEIFTILANKPKDYRENLPWYSDELGYLFDSIKSIYGPMDFSNLYFQSDVENMSSQYLINYIDQAFIAWSSPWSDEVVNFEDFCNYILPYRNFNEPLEDWRNMFIEAYKWIYDSIKQSHGIIEVAKILNVGSELKYSKAFDNYIIAIAPSLMLKAKYGDCANSSNFKAMIMRAFGIPVAIDFIPIYGTDHNIHFWNSVMDRNGNFVSFEEALDDINASVAYKYRLCKVYRKTFTKNQDLVQLCRRNNGDVPGVFKSQNFEDVTSEYVAASKVRIRIRNIPSDESDIFVCVFNNQSWTPVDYAKIESDGSVVFVDLGREVVYLPIYYERGNMYPVSEAFKISNKGFIQYLKPQIDTTSVLLTRKYHMHSRKLNWLKCLKNAVFEGSNDPEFKNSIELGKINNTPGEHFQEIDVELASDLKFVRLRFSPDEQKLIYDGDGASIAELKFFSQDGTVLDGNPIGSTGRKYNKYLPNKCFDNDPLTFYEDARIGTYTKYVGLEFLKPSKVSKIRYLPRNDMNSIQIGDRYELFYWDDSFISLGSKLAKDTILIFDSVPNNALLLLKDLSGGEEERVFTWESQKQVFW